VSRWLEVALGEVLTKSDAWIRLDPEAEYKEVRARLWGKGLELRRVVSGSEIASSRRLQVRAGQFLISRIDARHGAAGLIPDELDGAVVSNDYPAFDVDERRLVPEYLGWYSKTAAFVDACRHASEGTTNRVRLQEQRFLDLTMPLPPVEEQRRVVRKIERLAARVQGVTRLRSSAESTATLLSAAALRSVFAGERPYGSVAFSKDARALLATQAEKYRRRQRSTHNRACPERPTINVEGSPLPNGWVWTTLGSALTHLVDCVNDTPDFSEVPTDFLGLKTTNVRPYSLDLTQRWYMTKGDFDAWNRREAPLAGDLVLTREAPVGNACMLPAGLLMCLTQRLMLLRADSEFVSPEFVLHFLNSPQFKAQVAEASRGLTTPHVNVKDAPTFAMPLPPLEEQVIICAHLQTLRAATGRINALTVAETAELHALLPSALSSLFGDGEWDLEEVRPA